MPPRRRSTFGIDVSKFVKVAGENVDQSFGSVTLKIFNEIVQNTPVDTGRAKGSWTIGVDRLPTAFRNRKDKGGNLTIRAAQSKVSKAKAGRSFFIASNLLYMPRLEYGWSKQAPNGMVRRAIRKFRRFMRQAVRDAKRG